MYFWNAEDFHLPIAWICWEDEPWAAANVAAPMGGDVRRRQVCPDNCPFEEFSESGWLDWRVVQMAEEGAIVPSSEEQVACEEDNRTNLW